MQYNYLLLFAGVTVILFLYNSCNKENLYPVIEEVSYTDSLLFVKDTCLTISVKANDADGRINKIELIIDGYVVDSISLEPYVFGWCINHNDIGVHNLIIKVYDDNGKYSLSESILSILDYRELFYGDYNFMIISKYYQLHLPNQLPDTTYYSEGKVRPYQESDKYNCEKYKWPWDTTRVNLISIEFQFNKLTVTKIDKEGKFDTYINLGNSYQGGEIHGDTIKYGYGTGGLGFGYNYRIVGVKQ